MTHLLDYNYLFKVVIVGNTAVGKSSILLRYVDHLFYDNYQTTIGVDFKFKTISPNHNRIKFQIWDTAGQQRFRTITSAYYKDCHCVIIVYDITNCQSLKDTHQFWLKQIQKNTISQPLVYIIGNKIDQQQRRKVSKKEVEKIIQNRKILYWELSAKEDLMVVDLFEHMAQRLVQIQQLRRIGKVKAKQKLQRPMQNSQKRKKCC